MKRKIFFPVFIKIIIWLKFSSQPTQEIYHFTNSGVCSWYDFAVNIFKYARDLGCELAVKEVFPITTAEYPTPAVRPPYSVLSTRKISDDLGVIPPYWQDSLTIMLKKLLS